MDSERGGGDTRRGFRERLFDQCNERIRELTEPKGLGSVTRERQPKAFIIIELHPKQINSPNEPSIPNC